MDGTRSQGRVGFIGHAARLAMRIVREERDLRRAARLMPKPVPWDWAAPRLIPVFAGPVIDPLGESLVRVESELGPMVEIGLDLGIAMTYVDVTVAERWECSPDQLIDRGLQNLRERAARIDSKRLQTGVLRGRNVRLVRDRPLWVSSVLLSPDHLFRIFGGHDQIIVAPAAECLLSFSVGTPSTTIDAVVADFERASRRPLWLDPFLVSEGRLIWAAPMDDEEAWTS